MEPIAILHQGAAMCGARDMADGERSTRIRIRIRVRVRVRVRPKEGRPRSSHVKEGQKRWVSVSVEVHGEARDRLKFEVRVSVRVK